MDSTPTPAPAAAVDTTLPINDNLQSAFSAQNAPTEAIPVTMAEKVVYFKRVSFEWLRAHRNIAIVLGLLMLALLFYTWPIVTSMLLMYRIMRQTTDRDAALGSGSLVKIVPWIIVAALSIQVLWLVGISHAMSPGQ